MYQEYLNAVSFAILLHESNRSYPSRRRACFLRASLRNQESQIFFGPKHFFWLKLFLGPKISGSKILLHQNFFGLYYFGPSNFFWTQKFLKNFWTQNFFWTHKYLGTKIFFGPKILFGPNFFWTQNFFQT